MSRSEIFMQNMPIIGERQDTSQSDIKLAIILKYLSRVGGLYQI